METILKRSTSDQARTHTDEREWDPHRGSRIGPAWDRVVAALGDGRWHPWTNVVDSVMPGSGLLRSSVNSLIYDGLRHGLLVRKGRYSKRTKTDTRSLKLLNKEPRT